FLRGAGMRRTIVEHHGDVGTERALYFHRFLRSEKQQRTVEVRTELHAMRLDLADLRQAEDLEPAAVGEDGQGPVHEAMQSTGGADDVEAGAEIEMIGIAQE